MTRCLLAVLLLGALLGVARAELERARVVRLDSAIAQVQSGALPDTVQATDRSGRYHRVYCDSLGVWYQTGVAGDSGQVAWGFALALCRTGASSPVMLLDDPPRDDGRLWAVWKRQSDGAIRCRRKWLSDPIWQWSGMLDLTPSHPIELR